ncbi:MAG: hypothetical protein DRJ47_03430 [Thermoprotei archaeon]|nr:MAG: hypothetical protein DRJ47_03430 [Thermoprotei archaeon]
MRKYATISVLRKVKEILEKEKKNRDWSEFLLELYKEAKTARARTAFEELRRLLNENDLEEILRASREFRKGFRLG